MKLAVVFTGGTIGSQKKENGWIAPDSAQAYRLLECYKEQFSVQASDVDFTCIRPYEILSENLNAEYLDKLIQEVGKLINQEVYDGIIICHGTDTLQYSAAMLDYVYADAKLPILLVSSNYPLEDDRANGLYNFAYAVETARQGLQGVFVVYRNSDKRTYVHQGRKLLAHQTFEDNVFSVQQDYVGVYEEDGQWSQKMVVIPTTKPIEYHGLHPATDYILWLRAYPGIPYPELTDAIHVVLMESYHSGTIAINQELESFAMQAQSLNIPIYLLGAVSSTSGYETIQNYQRLGIQVLEHEAPIAVYCRFWLQESAKECIGGR
ncbi:MAG: asparaginase [Lachnospiraceae bacterium]|nr:asparaginase [Lachnospiraceae bacterium]